MVDRAIVEKNSRAEREAIVRDLSRQIIELNRKRAEIEQSLEYLRKAKAEISERL